MWPSIHVEHTKSKNDRRRGHDITEERMTSKCARSSKGRTDDYKRVFVLSNLPWGPVAMLQPTSHHAVNMRKITHYLCNVLECVRVHARVWVCRWWHMARVLSHIWMGKTLIKYGSQDSINTKKGTYLMNKSHFCPAGLSHQPQCQLLLLHLHATS